jgi:small subunit ribosomal protein S21
LQVFGNRQDFGNWFVCLGGICYTFLSHKGHIFRHLERQVSFLALVKLRDNEGFEQAFRRFKKSCEKSGILSEVKKREHFEKPSVRLKKKSMAARKRLLKKQKKTWD